MTDASRPSRKGHAGKPKTAHRRAPSQIARSEHVPELQCLSETPKYLSRRELQTLPGRAIYARRKAIGEPVFGQIKHRQGFGQFQLRGIDKVRGEWALVCLRHNILKVHRACCT